MEPTEVHLSVRLPRRLHDALSRAAAKEVRTLGAMARLALAEALARKGYLRDEPPKSKRPSPPVRPLAKTPDPIPQPLSIVARLLTGEKP